MKSNLRLKLRKAVKVIAASILFFLPASLPNTAQAQFGGGAFSGLKEVAKASVIGIETPFAGGSGVIIGRKGDRYFFLTARHVAQGNPQTEEFNIFTTGASPAERVDKFIYPDAFKGKDIAIGSFTSKKTYQLAPIFAITTHDSTDTGTRSNGIIAAKNNYSIVDNAAGKVGNKQELIQGDAIVAGISIPTKSITVSLFRTSTASIQDRAPGNVDGYELIYISPSTVPGMSGGGVLAARMCPDWVDGAFGGLIGIHGRSESYGSSNSRSGTSLGLPLDIFTDFFVKNSDTYGIPKGVSLQSMIEKRCKDGFWE